MTNAIAATYSNALTASVPVPTPGRGTGTRAYPALRNVVARLTAARTMAEYRAAKQLASQLEEAVFLTVIDAMIAARLRVDKECRGRTMAERAALGLAG